jgi:hypothetical protein
MSAVATAPDEALVSQPDRGTIFVSVRSNLRLVRTPRYPIYGPGGRTVGEEQGEVIQFRNSRLYVPDEGTVTLEDGREVDAADLKDWLLNHRRLNDKHDGFFALQTAAPPVTQAEIEAITRAVLAVDVDALERVLEQETNGWGRQEVIGPVQDALTNIAALAEQARAQAAAKEQADAAIAEKLPPPPPGA